MTRRRRDDTDYDQRTLANLMATIALLVMAIALTWTVQAYQRWMTLERCVAAGRRDCVDMRKEARRPVFAAHRDR